MTNENPSSASAAVAWQGIHHVALITPDLDSTVAFYRDVLGMQLLFTAPAGDMHGRHAGLQPRPDAGAVNFLHFFELPTAQIAAPPDLNTMYWLPGALHHISFGLPDEAAALAFRDRLSAAGVTTSEIMHQGNVFNFVFLDNNGMLLEAAWS